MVKYTSHLQQYNTTKSVSENIKTYCKSKIFTYSTFYINYGIYENIHTSNQYLGATLSMEKSKS